MKLDNRGWGLQELLIGLGVLFFSLLLIVVLINKNFKDLQANISGTENSNSSGNSSQSRPVESDTNYSSYKSIEDVMIDAAQKYSEDIYGNDLQEGDNLTVTLKSLIRDEYLEKITDIKDESIICSGYVTFIKKGNSVSYDPYLKCGKKYTTKGYLERFDADIE